MTDSDTLTIRVPSEVKAELGRLADLTNRTKSFLAGEAIAAYLARELEIVAGVESGLEDMKANRTVAHADAMARLRVAASGKGK